MIRITRLSQDAGSDTHSLQSALTDNQHTYNHSAPRQPFCFSLLVQCSINYSRDSALEGETPGECRQLSICTTANGMKRKRTASSTTVQPSSPTESTPRTMQKQDLISTMTRSLSGAEEILSPTKQNKPYWGAPERAPLFIDRST